MSREVLGEMSDRVVVEPIGLAPAEGSRRAFQGYAR
jgi:hypothetical protein